MVTVEVPSYTIKREPIELPSKETALIIVDMQNDFVKPEGKLFVPTAPQTVPVIKELLVKARKAGVLRVFTKDTHYPEDPEFKIWGEHVVKGSWGWEIIDELKPKVPEEIVIEKMRYDGFFGTSLDHILRVYGIRNLVVTGTVANICVLHTVASAAMNLYKVVVPVDGISALTEFDKHLTLRQIDFLYKGILTEAKYIVFK